MIYEPAEDSFLLEKAVKKFVKGKSFLDMGAGSGIQSIAAMQSGAKSVLAAEIDRESILILRRKGIKAIKSNLFSAIKGKFDVIAFNPPYLPFDSMEDKESRRATTGGKKGDEILLKFISSLKSHLTKKGFALIIVSSQTPMKRINILLKKNSLSKKLVFKEKLFFEELKVFRIFRNKKV